MPVSISGAGSISGLDQGFNVTTGSVGIGTDNPQANLHIFEGTGSTRAPAAAGNNLVIDSNSEVGMSLLFGTDANTAYGNIYWGNSTDGSADGRITYFGSTYTTAADRQAMVFRTANTERLRITSGGDLAVGATGDVYGPARLNVRPDNRQTQFSASDGNTWHDIVVKQNDTNASGGNAVGLAFEISTSGWHANAGTGIAAIKDSNSDDYGSHLAFITRPHAAVAEERLRITSDGHLLHGVTADEDTSGNGGFRFINSGDIQIDGDQKALVFRSTNNTAQLQSAIEWWNENGAGVQAKIAVDRTAVSQAPSDLVFYTSPNVDTGGTSSDGDITEHLRITSAGETLISNSANRFLSLDRTNASSGSGEFNVNVENNSQTSISYDDGAPLVIGTSSSPRTQAGFSEKVRISSEGYVTKPNQPAFSASLAGGNLNAATHNNVIIFNNQHFDNSNSYNTSNGRFTAPVAGKYYIGVQIYAGFDFSGVRVLHSKFQKNGNDIASADMFGGSSNHGGTYYHPTGCGHMLIDLAVNDWVAFNSGGFAAGGTGNAVIYAASGTRFFGYLVA